MPRTTERRPDDPSRPAAGGTRQTGRPADLPDRFRAFLLERHPFALPAAAEVVARLPERLAAPDAGRAGLAESLDRLRPELARELRARLTLAVPPGTAEPAPGVAPAIRAGQALEDIVAACDGFLRREALAASLTSQERREILRGMLLTRATDTRLKMLFAGGQVRYEGAAFQGKGFRSLGQEAIYAAGVRLRRGEAFRDPDGSWRGDVVGPVIRDLGVALAMRPEPESVRRVLSAQMGKAGPPMDGRDLHIGDFEWGVLPATAPLAISTLTIAGLAMAFHREGSGRVALSFIGEGGSSLGEWHEAINLCAARRLPAVFCVENNQTALSTPLADQSAVRTFADKASGYGVPGVTIDGTDPDRVAAAFAWAVERARAGDGPALLELVSMRMCGHAHHDDMLYLGKEPPPGWRYPDAYREGYVDAGAYAFWAGRDPLFGYAARLEAEGVIDPGELDRMIQEIDALADEQMRAVVEAPWPDPSSVGAGVVAHEAPRRRAGVLSPEPDRLRELEPLPPLDPGPPFDPKGRTFLEAIMLGLQDALRRDDRVFIYGQDVGGKYGNAFLLLRPLLQEFGDRILNSPLAEGAILGVCVGAALGGQRPIGEIQFNDFVATGFNQLVNNAAKVRYRWGASVPLVVRMPWGGLRHAGPYHSQNTEAWFYRTPGLKIVVPATPADARALLASAVADPDPVLYYEHIALYRDPRIKQALGVEPPEPLPLGRAALRRAGRDLAIVSYGAYVHVALRVAERLAADGIGAAVLDLRTLAPLDKAAVLALARHCSKVLIVHEDSRTGGIGESLAAVIQEEAFEFLDAPVRVLGALDTPVPYSPPLEAAFLIGEDDLEREARLLVRY